ncbi:hypothetical protein DFH09DRAFT_1319803 [Mycena vulgaris]|nr:hypothetical protein DFH09DRAFT_1319803 [Mycena vulgaris]
MAKRVHIVLTNVRHRAILRKALELFPAHKLETTFGTPTKLRVMMGNMCTLGQLGKIQSSIMRNDRLVRRETPAPDLPARQALIAYRMAYNVYFKTKGNAYAVGNPHAKYVLQDAEQTWHDWVVPYLATRGRPGRPTWALQPLPEFQRVRVVPAHPRAPAPRAATPRAATATVQTPSRRRTQFALPTPPPSSPVRTPAAHPQVGSRMQPMQLPDDPQDARHLPKKRKFLSVIDSEEEDSRPRKKLKSLGLIDLTN